MSLPLLQHAGSNSRATVYVSNIQHNFGEEDLKQLFTEVRPSLKLPWFEFPQLLDSKLLPEVRGHFTHPKQIHDSNYTQLSVKALAYLKNGPEFWKWSPYKVACLFYAKKDRNGPPGANQGISTPEPKHGCFRVHPWHLPLSDPFCAMS